MFIWSSYDYMSQIATERYSSIRVYDLSLQKPMDPNVDDLNSHGISPIEGDDNDGEGDCEMVVEEDENEDREPVTLGFVEKPKNPTSLLRHFFPSKAGGVPAWLDPLNLPGVKSRSCGFCENPLQFLLQVFS